MLAAFVFSLLMLAAGVILYVGQKNARLETRVRELEQALRDQQAPAPAVWPAGWLDDDEDTGPFDRASGLLVERGDEVEVDEFDDQEPEAAADDWSPEAPEPARDEKLDDLSRSAGLAGEGSR